MKLNSCLITGSKYCGTIHHRIGVMDGFGSYTYPDGSAYRGFFKMGKLHGYGCLTTRSPRKFLFFTEFKEGKLVNIEEIVFSDGLKFTNLLCGKNTNFSTWTYLNEHDRRYASELYSDIEPVGPNAYLTNNYQTRDIPFNQYDSEEGFYNPRSGFVGYCCPNMASQSKLRFVSCYKEKNWIRRNCRRHDVILLPETLQIEIERDILKNNKKFNSNREYCVCENKKFFIGPNDSRSCYNMDSSIQSSSRSSFKDVDLHEQSFMKCAENKNSSRTHLDKPGLTKSFKLVQKPVDYYFKL